MPKVFEHQQHFSHSYLTFSSPYPSDNVGLIIEEISYLGVACNLETRIGGVQFKHCFFGNGDNFDISIDRN